MGKNNSKARGEISCINLGRGIVWGTAVRKETNKDVFCKFVSQVACQQNPLIRYNKRSGYFESFPGIGTPGIPAGIQIPRSRQNVALDGL